MIHRLLEADARYSAQLRLAAPDGLRRRAAIVFAHSGDSWFVGAGLLGVWWLGSAAWKVIAIEFIVGIAVTAAVVLTIKLLVRRRRPAGEWGAIYRKADPHSFPSGHAARMAMLVVLGAGLGPLWFAGALLLWAPLVALARVAMGVHYLSDVLVGALLGIGVGLAMLPVLITL